MAKYILKATSDTWDNIVLKAEGLVMVEFWTMWCTPCREMSPMIKEVADEFADNVTVVKLERDQNEDIAEKYKVVNVPSFLFFREGERIDRVGGVLTKAELKERIEANL